MPLFTRLCIKTALIYLLTGLAGTALLPLIPVLFGWRAVFFHFLSVGWVTQMIVGVAWWLFPLPDQPDRKAPLVWALYGCLNGGLLLRALADERRLKSPLVDVKARLKCPRLSLLHLF